MNDAAGFLNMKRTLSLIVISQFFCTSLWFAGNAILPDILKAYHLEPGFLAWLTSTVQLGFITGTLTFAIYAISDRFSPSKVFFLSSIMAGIFNFGMLMPGINSTELLIFRLLTGFFLAGVYPVGMKIAADHYLQGLGKSLGFLVGALVLGTALPHLLKSIGANFPWKYVVFLTSALSVSGGMIVFFLIPNGPHRKQGHHLNLRAVLSGFRDKNFRAAAFGYFGHMWELYTFWAFVPGMLSAFVIRNNTQINIPLASFFIIASGALGCAASGLLSQKRKPKQLAKISLALSGLCCLLSPVFIAGSSTWALVIFLCLWGLFVAADSPMFSTLVANHANADSRGSALTIVNCIGFAITIISIQITNLLSYSIGYQYVFLVLSIGPILGFIALIYGTQIEKK